VTENKPYIEAMRDLRKGSRTSPHRDARTKRLRTKGAAMQAAMKEYR
jgi:hypothetical protein